MKMFNGDRYDLNKKQKVRYTREEIAFMVDNAETFYKSRGPLRTLHEDFETSRAVYCKEFKQWLDEVAPSEHREWLHRLEYNTIFSFEVVRGFFLDVMVPELKTFANKWEIAVYYQYLEKGSVGYYKVPYPIYSSGVVCLHWAGEFGVVKKLRYQSAMIEDWKLPK